MKTLTRRLTLSIATLAVVFGMFFVSVPKASASRYLCFLQYCDANYCYYNCYYIGE